MSLNPSLGCMKPCHKTEAQNKTSRNLGLIVLRLGLPPLLVCRQIYYVGSLCFLVCRKHLYSILSQYKGWGNSVVSYMVTGLPHESVSSWLNFLYLLIQTTWGIRFQLRGLGRYRHLEHRMCFFFFFLCACIGACVYACVIFKTSSFFEALASLAPVAFCFSLDKIGMHQHHYFSSWAFKEKNDFIPRFLCCGYEGAFW